MKKYRYISVIVLLLALVSCKDFIDVNDDPNNPKTVPAQKFLPTVLYYGSQSVYDHGEYGVYLSQALTTTGKSQTGSYAFKSGWDFMVMNRHPQWRRHYYDIGVNVNYLLDDAQPKSIRNYELVARTIRLMSTLNTTDMFGAMPHSDAYKSISPKYDEQIDIYKWMIKEADDLLSLYNNPAWINAPTNVAMTEKQDRIYKGDLQKWKSFTYALKARIHLRKLPNWEPTKENCQIIINACDSALVNWQEPRYNYPGGNIAEKNNPWSTAQPKVNSWESNANQLDKAIPSKFFVSTMLGYYDGKVINLEIAKDPRLSRLMKPRSGPSSDPSIKYRYLENNIGKNIEYTETHFPNLYYVDNQQSNINTCYSAENGYVSLMLTEELYLIKAEALYWTGDKNGAREATIEAVKSNMGINRHNVNTTLINRYLLKPEFFPSSSDFTIGHIMRQKWICMYLQPEMWTDMRRYKYSNERNKILYDGEIIYPGLRRPYNLLESVWANNEDWVQRVNYDPETEPMYNKQELERLGAYQNPNWLKKPMIWAE